MNKFVTGFVVLSILTAVACSQPGGRAPVTTELDSKGSDVNGSAAKSPASVESDATAKKAEEIVMAVEGMTCGGCASGIEGKLSGMPGVLKCNVDYAKKEARVSIDPGKQNKSAVISSIQSLGFSAKEKN